MKYSHYILNLVMTTVLIGCMRDDPPAPPRPLPSVELIPEKPPAELKYLPLTIDETKERLKLTLNDARKYGDGKRWSFGHIDVVLVLVNGDDDSHISDVSCSSSLVTLEDSDDHGQGISGLTIAGLFPEKTGLLKSLTAWFKTKPTPPAKTTIDGLQFDFALVNGHAVLMATAE